MSVTGYIKGQLTKAANALRKNQPSTSSSLTVLILWRTQEKWTYAENYAYENPGNDGSRQLLEEFQSHWESNGLDNHMEEVEGQ
ncbi:hypothetical protein Aduo_012344 [Ancylostoma duodenale]